MLRHLLLVLSAFSLIAFVGNASAQEPPPVPREALEFEVTFARWTLAKDAEMPSPQADKIDLGALEKSGQLAVMQRMKVTTLSGQPATFQLGERRAEVTGVAFGGGRGGAGPVQSQVNYSQFGTMLKITGRVEADERIVAELSFERSAPRDGNRGPVIGEVQGEKVRAAEATTMVVKTQFAAANGKTVVVSAAANESAETREVEVVTVTAKILKP